MGSTTKLEDLCTAIVDCPHSTPKWTESGIVVLRNTNIKGGRLDLSDPSFTDEEHYLDRVRRAVPEPGDLVITREAPMGEVCMIPSGLQCCLGQRMVLLKPDATKVHPRYLLFALQSRHVQNQIRANEGTGSTVSNLRIPLLKSLSIPMQDFATQEAVATILGAIDDKIELNRRMSRTLGEIGQTIFRAWFIDFSSKPFSESSTSTIGQSPPDWHRGTIGDLVERRTQRIGHASATVLSAISEGALVRSEDHFKKRVHSKNISKYLAVHQWDFAYNPSRINIGSIGLHKEPYLGAVSPVYVVTRPKPGYHWFLRFLLLEDSTKEWIRTLSSGSVRQSLSFDAFASIPCIIPRYPEIEAFNVTWNRLWSAIRLREIESATLSQLRDTLLPKLISGEFRVPHAEQLVSEAV